MKNIWIDFKTLRANLDFEQVLRHYRVEIKRTGKQHHGYCPLPNHNGKRNSPSFSANLERGVFQCFGCGGQGNVLEFAALMERVDPRDGSAFRQLAIQLQERFCSNLGQTENVAEAVVKEKRLSQVTESKTSLPVLINAPLNFELKDLDKHHSYALDRGFNAETIAHFGLGYCSRGMLKGRLAIPLHDQQGRLIGYAGRLVNDAAETADNPRYRLPGKREREGKTFEFRKTRFLYNGFRIKAPVDNLIVVEGFTSAWWLHQNGYGEVVATMGADCSEKQAELIISLIKPDGCAWLVPDGDPAGERLAQSLFFQLSIHRFVRLVKLENDSQPTDMSLEEIKTSFPW